MQPSTRNNSFPGTRENHRDLQLLVSFVPYAVCQPCGQHLAISSNLLRYIMLCKAGSIIRGAGVNVRDGRSGYASKAHEMYSSMKQHVRPSLFVEFTIDRQSKNAKPVALSPDLSPAYSM